MIRTAIIPAVAMTALLAGCMPPPPPPPPAPISVAPPPPVPVQGIQGIETRKAADMCGASNYSSSISQPGSVIPTLGISKDYRVVEYRGIEPQDYNPTRIVFRLDSTNSIQSVECG